MTNDFLTRLRNGEDISAIANEITDSLNEANKVYLEEQEKKRQADSDRRNKVDVADDLLLALFDLLDLYDIDTDPLDDLTPEDVVDLCDEVMPVLKAYAGFFEELKDIDKAKDKTCHCEKCDDPIADFLKKFVD
jgi:hypothetical protein